MGEPPAPFVRFSRDKRGYESVYLVHVSGRPPRPRVLYWFRTPPGVKLGRTAFDENVRKALEAQYPELRFDWKRISETQPPPVSEVEHWRERRRAERTAKQARQAAIREREELNAAGDGIEPAPGVGAGFAESDVPAAASEEGPPDDLAVDASAVADANSVPDELLEDDSEDETEATPLELAVDGPVSQPVPQGEGGVVPQGRRRRRRRRGGRGRHRHDIPGTPGAAAQESAGQPAGPSEPPAASPAADPEFRADPPARGEEPTS